MRDIFTMDRFLGLGTVIMALVALIANLTGNAAVAHGSVLAMLILACGALFPKKKETPKKGNHPLSNDREVLHGKPMMNMAETLCVIGLIVSVGILLLFDFPEAFANTLLAFNVAFTAGLLLLSFVNKKGLR